jgi:tetratricopeptide (TPR) repeat protein
VASIGGWMYYWFVLDGASMVRIANIVFVLGFVLCSVVISFDTTMDYTAPRFLIWAVTALILFVFLAKRLEYSPIFIPLLIYWLLTTFSILLAVNKGEAVNQSLIIITMIAYLAVVSVLLKNNEIFPKAVVLVTIVLSTYSYYDTKGMMANKNQCAAVLFLLSILCLHYYKYWKLPVVMAVVLSSVSILLLRARAVWLAVLVVGIVFAVTNRKYLIPLICTYVILGCIAFCFNVGSAFNTESMSHRKELWKNTLRLIRDNPHGIGAANWKVVYPVTSRDAPLSRRFNYQNKFFIRAHNYYLQTCSEIGIFGLLSYLSVFVYAIYCSRGWIRMGIIAYMVIIFFSISGNRMFPSLLLTIFLAHAIKGRPLFLKPVFVPLMGVLLIAAVANFSIRYSGARQVVRIYKAQAVNDWDKVLAETEKISRWSDIDTTCATPLAHYRGIAYHFKGDNVNAMKSFEDAAKAAPFHLYNLMNLADMYTVDGQYNEAKAVYRRVIWMYPDFEAAREGIYNIDAVRRKIFEVVQEINRLKQRRM